MVEVQLRNIHKSFGSHDVIKGVDLKIEDGEFVVFVGPSGSGKSTMLRILAGLEDVTSGSVEIGGSDVTYASPADRGIAMVFQSYALYPHMSVYENIAFNLRLNKLGKADIDKRVKEAAQILKLTEYLQRKPSQLSGGQRQRVAIGRAIVRDPDVFLFDEPLSNLDAALRVETRFEIEKLHRDLDATMVYVTHDQVEAMTLADRIVAFDDGKIQQIGSPLELYHHPNNLFVAGFIGSPRMNFLAVESNSSGGAHVIDNPSIKMPLPRQDIAPEASLTLGIRPEAVQVSEAGDAPENEFSLNGKITSIEQLGHVSYAHITCNGVLPFVVQVGTTFQHRRGDNVRVCLPQERLHLFDENGNAIHNKSPK